MKAHQPLTTLFIGFLLVALYSIDGRKNAFDESGTSLNDFETESITGSIDFDPVWEQSMLVAPLAIQLLGQLLLVSGVKDASLKEYVPDREFRYIKHPQSLRATLSQISHEGHRAFLNGHWAMNSVQLNMEQIPRSIKTVLKILAQDFPKSVYKRLLPKALRNIADLGRHCVTKTNNTKNEFYNVMLLIEEVVETTKVTETEHLSRVDHNEREMEVLRQLQTDLAREEKIRSESYREASEAVRVAEQLYFSALKEIPTGFKALLFDLSRGFVKVLVDTAKIGSTLITGRDEPITKKVFNVADTILNKRQESMKVDISFSLEQTLNMADKLAKSLGKFEDKLNETKNDPKSIEAFTTIFRVTREFIQSLPENKAKAPVLELVEQAEQLSINVTREIKKVKLKTSLKRIWIAEIQRIDGQLNKFQAAHLLRNPEENIEMLQEKSDTSNHEALKAQVTQKFLLEARRRQDTQMADYLKLMETMRANNAKMISMDLTTINYREIIEMLQETMKLLTQIQTQWRDLTRFFGTVFTCIQSMIQGPLRSFLDITSDGSEMDHVLRLRLISVLKDDVYGIHKSAYLLHVMSKTYFNVSSKYIMTRLSSLSNLMIVKSSQERRNLMTKLNAETNDAIERIQSLVLKTKENFSKQLDAKTAKITNLIMKLGGSNETVENTIESAAKMIRECEEASQEEEVDT